MEEPVQLLPLSAPPFFSPRRKKSPKDVVSVEFQTFFGQRFRRVRDHVEPHRQCRSSRAVRLLMPRPLFLVSRVLMLLFILALTRPSSTPIFSGAVRFHDFFSELASSSLLPESHNSLNSYTPPNPEASPTLEKGHHSSSLLAIAHEPVNLPTPTLHQNTQTDLPAAEIVPGSFDFPAAETDRNSSDKNVGKPKSNELLGNSSDLPSTHQSGSTSIPAFSGQRESCESVFKSLGWTADSLSVTAAAVWELVHIARYAGTPASLEHLSKDKIARQLLDVVQSNWQTDHLHPFEFVKFATCDVSPPKKHTLVMSFFVNGMCGAINHPLAKTLWRSLLQVEGKTAKSIVDAQGNNVLHLAVLSENPRMVQLAARLAAGHPVSSTSLAMFEAKNFQNQTAYDLAHSSSYSVSSAIKASLKASYRALSLFLKRKADTRAKHQRNVVVASNSPSWGSQSNSFPRNESSDEVLASGPSPVEQLPAVPIELSPVSTPSSLPAADASLFSIQQPTTPAFATPAFAPLTTSPSQSIPLLTPTVPGPSAEEAHILPSENSFTVGPTVDIAEVFPEVFNQ